MSDDLISRQAAIDIFDDYDIAVENGEIESYRRYREQLSCLPSVQPKTGRWESAYNSTEEGYPYNYCSECGFETGARCFWNYCPNCGAKMEGEL